MMDRFLMTRQQVLAGALGMAALLGLPAGRVMRKAQAGRASRKTLLLVTRPDLASAAAPLAADPDATRITLDVAALVMQFPAMQLASGTRLLHIGDAADHELVHAMLPILGFPRLLHTGHHPKGAMLNPLFDLLSGHHAGHSSPQILAPHNLSCLIAEI